MPDTTPGLSPEQFLAGSRGRRLLLEFAVASERQARDGDSGPLGRAVFAASYRLSKLNGNTVFLVGEDAGHLGEDHVPSVFPEDVAKKIAAMPLATPTETLFVAA